MATAPGTPAPGTPAPAARRRRRTDRTRSWWALHRRGPASLLAVAVGLAVLAGCISAPGSTAEIEQVTTVRKDGWTYEVFRNRAYPCSLSGYQTFAIGTKDGSSRTASAPLWVKMHGGGVGFFDLAGNPQPGRGQKVEEGPASLVGNVDPGLMARVQAAPEGFRLLVVSMCDHDLYAGTGADDPYNPGVEADGTPITTNGLVATKAAVQFTRDRLPTGDFFLHGGSAGSAGTFSVAWGLQEQGLPPTGIIADSGIINQLWEQAQIDQGGPCARGGADLILPRLDPAIADPANQPHLLVSSGRLQVPVLHVWNKADKNTCGTAPMACPLPDGTTPTMWSATCVHTPMRLAILGQGAGSRSEDLALCVDDPTRPDPCDVHVPSTKASGVNTDPGAPADFNGEILRWVRARMADA